VSVLMQVWFGLVWLLLGGWRLAGVLTATRDVLAWDWILTAGYFTLSLFWFVSAYLKARKNTRLAR
jgi:hypothetical protein